MLRLSFMLTIALMLSACSAYAFGAPGSVVVDIVGSTTDNTLITAAGPEKVELEIIGSQANNTLISPPVMNTVICPKNICPEVNCYTEQYCEEQVETQPWDNMHLGVDAWYGTYWYTDINLPQWPQF